jgi:hypothetical protein
VHEKTVIHDFREFQYTLLYNQGLGKGCKERPVELALRAPPTKEIGCSFASVRFLWPIISKTPWTDKDKSMEARWKGSESYQVLEGKPILQSYLGSIYRKGGKAE